MNSPMKIVELPENVKNKLEEAVELWAEEYLEGKPRILGAGIYFSLEKCLIEQTNKIFETFKGKKS